jgi:hypothetical protein
MMLLEEAAVMADYMTPATRLAHESPGLSRQAAVADNINNDKVETHMH